MLPPTLTDPAALIAERLIARGQTIAVAESSAGGLISAALLSVPGASAYYRGGVVIYTLEGVRALFADVPALDPGVRSASEPFACYLADSVAAKLGTDWGVSETGASGPRGNGYGDPAGHAWLGIHGPAGPARAGHVLTGSADRQANMERFAAEALGRLVTALGA